MQILPSKSESNWYEDLPNILRSWEAIWWMEKKYIIALSLLQYPIENDRWSVVIEGVVRKIQNKKRISRQNHFEDSKFGSIVTSV